MFINKCKLKVETRFNKHFSYLRLKKVLEQFFHERLFVRLSSEVKSLFRKTFLLIIQWLLIYLLIYFFFFLNIYQKVHLKNLEIHTYFPLNHFGDTFDSTDTTPSTYTYTLRVTKHNQKNLH